MGAHLFLGDPFPRAKTTGTYPRLNSSLSAMDAVLRSDSSGAWEVRGEFNRNPVIVAYMRTHAIQSARMVANSARTS